MSLCYKKVLSAFFRKFRNLAYFVNFRKRIDVPELVAEGVQLYYLNGNLNWRIIPGYVH